MSDHSQLPTQTENQNCQTFLLLLDLQLCLDTRIPFDFYTLQVEALERLVSLSKPIRARVLLALREATKDPPLGGW